MGKVFQVNRVYSCFHPHCRLLLALMREHCREKSGLDLHIFCCFQFLWQCRNSSKPITRFSEDSDLFLHVDSVYLATLHLRHPDLLFIPPGQVLRYSEEGTVLRVHCRKVCVYVCGCEDGLYGTTLT